MYLYPPKELIQALKVTSMILSQSALKLLESFEGLRLQAYLDIKGILTIGYGHTGKDVHTGLVITQDQANKLLQLDIVITETAVSHLVHVPINQNQYDALCLFAYNVGTGSLASSTLLKDLNTGNMSDITSQFLRWDHAGNLEVAALHNRRLAEATLFTKAA